MMLTEFSSRHTALSNGLSLWTKSPSGHFPAVQTNLLKTLLKVCWAYSSHCSGWCHVRSWEVGMHRLPISFAKLRKLHLLAHTDPEPGKAGAAAASKAIPFQGVRLLTKERPQMFTEWYPS